MCYFWRMLTKDEENFVKYWEANSEQEGKFLIKLLAGLPMAMLFGLPIILFVVVVYIFFPDWYAKAGGEFSSSLGAVIVAVLLSIIFFAFFRKHFEWEQKQNQYLRLKHKSENPEQNATNTDQPLS